MNLCFNVIFIIRDVLLIREALVNDMWWHSATVGVLSQQEVFLSPNSEFSDCSSRVDFQSSLV